ncbi:MAG: hypothetical protein KDD46_07355 [Bdellovibrionales bacterium]|nr:hypothetical protein [Bdellovibrionales bacterium]
MKSIRVLLIVLLVSASFFGCTKKENVQVLTKEGKSAFLQGEHDDLLVDKALDLLELTENFDVSNFESQQVKAFELLEPTFKAQAQNHLHQRVEDIKTWGGKQVFFPNEDQIQIEAREHFSGGIEARVTVPGVAEFTDAQGSISTKDVEYKVTMVAKNLSDIQVTLWTSKNL